jgi:hypothetical protein
MSEEQEQGGGFFSNLKNQIITGAGAILATIGTVFIDEIKSIIGIGEDETEQVQGVQNNNSQQQNQSVIINIPEQKAVETKTVIREVPAKSSQPAPAPVKKKEKEQEVDW